MAKWVNLTTMRGDIIAKITDHLGNPLDVDTVADIKQILVDHSFIFASKPMSPKATPRLVKVYEDGTEEHFTEAEEAQAALGLPPAEGSKPYMIKKDPDSMRITYTGVGSIFNAKNIVINAAQVVSACVMDNQEELDEISQQVYAVTLSGSNA